MRRTILRIFILLASFTLGLAAIQAQNPPAERRYADGPLTPADFKMAAPATLPIASTGGPLHAATFTQMKFSYQYRFENVARQFQVKATEADCYAVLTGETSWIAKPEDAGLLLHEQGHFDITEIHARRTREKLNKQVVDGAYQGVGATEIEARDKMLVILNRDFEVQLSEMRAEQALYDRETMHGRNAEVQTQWDRKFADQLAKLPAKKGPAGKADPKKPEPGKKPLPKKGKTAKDEPQK